MRIFPWTGAARLVWLLFLLTTLAAAGCSKPKCTVSGKVLYKGAPLKGGIVTFINDDGYSQPGTISEDGSYTIRGIHPGEVKITVETESVKPTMEEKRGASKHPYQAPKPPGGEEDLSGYQPKNVSDRAKRYVRIPEKYGKAEESTLKFTVERGEQSFDITVPDQ
jgi:hypothetical protein